MHVNHDFSNIGELHFAEIQAPSDGNANFFDNADVYLFQNGCGEALAEDWLVTADSSRPDFRFRWAGCCDPERWFKCSTNPDILLIGQLESKDGTQYLLQHWMQ